MKNFPSQLIADSKKDKKWCEQMLDAIVSRGDQDDGVSSKSKSKDIKNYQIYNGVFAAGDYSYLTEQYGASYPARLVNYPIVQPKIDLLLGEDLHRPMDTKVVTVNEDAVNRKEGHKTQLIMNKLLEDIKVEMGEMGLNTEHEGDSLPIPEDIDAFMRYNYKEGIEEAVQDGLEYLIGKYKYKNIFKEGLRDLLITGKEIYRVLIKDGDPKVRRVDPRSTTFDLSGETDDLAEANWISEERWLSPNDIVDEFRDELTDEETQTMKLLTLGWRSPMETLGLELFTLSGRALRLLNIRLVLISIIQNNHLERWFLISTKKEKAKKLSELSLTIYGKPQR